MLAGSAIASLASTDRTIKFYASKRVVAVEVSMK